MRDVTLDLDMSWSPLVFALAPDGPAGYVTTIVEMAHERKCRLAFDSIAPRYAAGAFSNESLRRT
jgi:hypothetical protein